MKLNKHHFWIMLLIVVTACVKDPYEDVVSNERSIEAVRLGQGFTQVGPALIDREAGRVSVQVLMEEGTDFSSVAPAIQASYRAKMQPESGATINFAASGNKQTYLVTSESGLTREWVIELVPFTETLPGTYKIAGQVVYGGTGPEWGGGAVMNLTDKKEVWPETGGPEAELDNTLVFEFGGVTPEGHTYGTVTNSAGNDGMFADYQFSDEKHAVDVNYLYRKIPTGTSTWLRNYTTKTITFTFEDGTTAIGTVSGPQTIDLGNGHSKVITETAFDFVLNTTDDWVAIYSDYDKLVKRPRRFWIDVEKLP